MPPDVDALLLAGATREQLAATRGAVDNHLRHLADEHGLAVTRTGGEYRFVVASEGTPTDPVSLPVSRTDRTPAGADAHPPSSDPPAGFPVEVRGAVTTHAGDPRGRLQRLKLWLEIVSVTVAILGGLAALVYRLLG